MCQVKLQLQQHVVKMELNERQEYKLRYKTGAARTLATLRKKKEDRKKS